MLGRSRKVAFEKAIAVFESLKISHDAIYKANFEMINNQIQLIDDQINQLNKDQSFKGRESKVSNPYNAVIDSLLIQDRVRQLREMQNQKMAFIMSLSSVMTYNTRLLGSVWISQRPVTPNYQLISLAALAIGLFLSVSRAFLHRSLSD